ncbi:MAG TPA: hypothetical protein VJ521_13985 [Acidobacteriota bacterium]|nr:hypothetical protein [Acidobacteriota bacterium]
MKTLLIIGWLLLQNSINAIGSRDLLAPPQNVKTGVRVAQNIPRVETVLFKDLPQSEGALWSSWGDGCLASNRKYYTAIGDHRGYDGNSYVYEYDPGRQALKKIVDIAAAIGQKKGDYGHGKIHARIHEYRGALYFATYRGNARQAQEARSKGYKGSLLFRYDLKTSKLENLGTIVPGQDLPTASMDADRGLLYFYTVENGDLLVYDLNKRSVKFKGGSQWIALYRSMMLGKDGKLYFADAKGKLSFYDPATNAITTTSLVLPGAEPMLRAATRRSSDGRIWGMTKAGRIFEFNPAKNSIRDLGTNILSGEYTAIMVLSPDEKYIYYAPGSHGSAVHIGTPVVQYHISSGNKKIIAFLREALINESKYYIGGNYNMQIDPKGATLYCTFNGANFTQQKNLKPFGLPSVVVITIPEAERK